MAPLQFPWLLANNFENFIAGLFMVIAFVGWVLNLINQNQPGGKPPVRRGQPPRQEGAPRPEGGENSAQKEIEKFLSQSRQANKPRPRAEEVISSDGVEVINRPSPSNPDVRRAPPSEQRRRTQKEIWEEQIGQPRSQEPRPVVQAPQRSNPGRNTGNDQRPKQKRRPANSPNPPSANIPQAAFRAPQLQPSPPVSNQIGARPISVGESGHVNPPAPSLQPQNSVAHKVMQMMRSPQGIQNAILLNEILSRPKSLRKN